MGEVHFICPHPAGTRPDNPDLHPLPRSSSVSPSGRISGSASGHEGGVFSGVFFGMVYLRPFGVQAVLGLGLAAAFGRAAFPLRGGVTVSAGAAGAGLSCVTCRGLAANA